LGSSIFIKEYCFLMKRIKKNIGYIIVLAPLIFICHFLEEAPGFVSWFNSHVSRGITPGLFQSVNISALVITLFIIALELFEPFFLSAMLIVLWFSFLMLANAIFHIKGALVDQKYMPGLITAIILYIPYYFWIVARIVKTGRMKASLVTGFALLGSLPMLIHGYMILFNGSRLF
jgi:hypothetical protein